LKIIFLDADGVLNSGNRWKELQPADPDNPLTKLDPDAVKRLRRIVESSPDIFIVLSSTWRLYSDTRRALISFCLEHDIPHDVFIGDTPGVGSRGEEIRTWLNDHPEITQFVALDDDYSDMEQFGTRYIQTEFYDGLQDEHVERAITLLKD
jgi:hypothetical protein